MWRLASKRVGLARSRRQRNPIVFHITMPRAFASQDCLNRGQQVCAMMHCFYGERAAISVRPVSAERRHRIEYRAYVKEKGAGPGGPFVRWGNMDVEPYPMYHHSPK